MDDSRMKTLCQIFVILMVLLLSPFKIMAKEATKHALLVGISMYQKGTDWNNISGTNDVDLLQPALKGQGFCITCLRNAEATHKNIIKTLSSLVSKVRNGDIVYLHFSGHGQAVEDLNNDEKDGWDEAFIPYDAAKTYSTKYRGKNHLLDDELGKYINSLRKKLGAKGMLYVVIDACHSGTMDRESFPPTRGTKDAFTFNNKVYRVKHENQTHYPLTANKNISKIIMLEACGSEETNQEIRIGNKYYGPLSYSVYKTIQNNGLKAEKSWVDNVRTQMSSLHINHKQRMIDQTAL